MTPIYKIEVNLDMPRAAMRFTTAGDWCLFADGRLRIDIVAVADWRYAAIVLMHELTEIFVCRMDGTTSAASDEFDALWEKELAEGLHNPEDEAGFDRRCPYRRGHIWGARMERLFCLILRVPWKKYNSFWDDFFRTNYAR